MQKYQILHVIPAEIYISIITSSSIRHNFAKLGLDKASTDGELVNCINICNVPNTTKHVLLKYLKTATAANKFLEEISGKTANFRKLHDDDSTVCYILNLNTEDTFAVKDGEYVMFFCKNLYGLTDTIGCQ